MERDIGDILDRWSISFLKKERIGSEESKKEFEAFTVALAEIRIKCPQFDWEQLSKFMKDINDFIWILESGLRSGKEKLNNPFYIMDTENNDTLAKIGLTSMIIRNFNHLRVSYKNIINKLVGTGFQDQKKDHLSE